MRVCLICEGSYPYVPGGVSSWIQMIVNELKDIEFVVWAIGTSKDEMSQFAYPIPKNILQIQTLYLGENTYKKSNRKIKLTNTEKESLKGLISDSVDSIDINWKGILELVKRHHGQMADILSSKSFFDLCLDEYKRRNSKKVFLHFLWNMRGIYFPFMHLFSQEIPEADIYHAVSAGYAGILGSCASYVNEKPLLLSEHGIYTREREEDIIRSEWVSGEFKEIWIDFFKKLSYITYQQASVVTTLFETNRTLQIELKCPAEKIVTIPNGINADDYAACRNKPENRRITLGAILRIVPIKDVKTMLLAFDIVKKNIPEAILKLMGNKDENPTYFQECAELLDELGTKDVELLGQVNIKEYLPDIDLLLLSSISEGQPLAILEGLASEIPFVATNVGDCRALLMGGRADDHFGPAGFIIPVMNSEAMAEAIITAIKNPNLLKQMGVAGRKRVEKYYNRDTMLSEYRNLYDQLGGKEFGRNRI